MSTPIEHLIEACSALRSKAIAAGQAVELAKVEGKKMRELRALEIEHRTAWGRFYAVDERLHSLRGEQ